MNRENPEGSREYPERPYLGVGAVIIDGDRVLLVKRGTAPLKGEWSLPGGVLEVGETLREGIVREVLEETGLRIEPLELAGVYDRIIPDADGKPQYHYVLVDYIGKVTGGELRAGSDVTDVRWEHEAEIVGLRLAAATEQVIREVFERLRKS